MSGCGDDDLEGIAGAWDVSPASGVQWAQPPAGELRLFVLSLCRKMVGIIMEIF